MKHRTVGASDADIRRARALRRKMTLPEVVLWHHLRKRPDGLRFRRQFPCRSYVLDNLDGLLTCILTVSANRSLHRDAARRGPPPRSGEDC